MTFEKKIYFTWEECEIAYLSLLKFSMGGQEIKQCEILRSNFRIAYSYYTLEKIYSKTLIISDTKIHLFLKKLI